MRKYFSKPATRMIVFVAVFLVGAYLSLGQVSTKGKPIKKPPKPVDPPSEPLAFALHNIAASDFCGSLHLFQQLPGLQYEKTWTGGSEDVANYWSMQIADANNDGELDLVAGAEIRTKVRNEIFQNVLVEAFQTGDTTAPSFRGPEVLDTMMTWLTRVLVADVDGIPGNEIILKTGQEIHVYTLDIGWNVIWSNIHKALPEAPGVYYKDITLGDVNPDGSRNIIASACNYDLDPDEGFLRIFSGNSLEFNDYYPMRADHHSGNPDLIDIDCYYIEDIRAFNLDADPELEILSTSQAHDFNYSDRKHDYFHFTHLHVWDWDYDSGTYIPLADYKVDNLNVYLSIASFDVGYIEPGRIGVVIGTHSGLETVTILAWDNGTNSFSELISGDTPFVTGGEIGEVWHVSLADVDGNSIDEIIFSGANPNAEKAYLGVHRWDFANGLIPVWTYVDESCDRFRTHGAN